MTVIKQALIAGSIIIVGLVANVFMPADIRTQPVNADQAFDHSDCQYPNRDTNPPNGCDNSDPACPETIKYGYDCEPKTAEPVTEQPTAPVQSAPTPTVNSCKGE